MSSNQRSPNELLTARANNIPRGILTAHPIVVDHAEGAYIWDTDGRRYLDFVGGIGVINVGHNHPRVKAAVEQQLKRLTHTAFQVAAYEPYIALAERLNKLVGKGAAYKSVFLTTGAEAVENAIKIARSYTNRPGVISFRGGFHGRTLLGVTLTGFAQPYKQNFGPFAGEVFHSAYPDSYRGITTEGAISALEEVFATQVAPDRVAAIVIEPVQGDGGFLQAPPEFLRALREITERHGIVLIADEIQTGFGRTGKLFGFEHAGIQPDLVTVAKSLAGGFPLSGVVGKAEIMDAPAPGGLGGTYGGNPIACAAALAVLDAFEQDGLVERAAALGTRLSDALEALKANHTDIGVVRGIGFMRAIEFVTDSETRKPDADRAQQVMVRARERGLLVIKCGVHRNIVRFLAPVVLSDDDLDEAMRILGEALDADKISAAA
ncbi:4-aminobutyrate--2-oxoglutarate transaminase [Mesorhizobium tamadayense]|uniref:4-aminobutyrate--2-oxoglutarate transaminase n=1 Tax=Mesorhizobium tamadayense TaxID=425306 RepID=A0A3P3FDX9_9HYPH|nr:4-aminobutyrate--2-oxoglutarate transaminase [Mesorhizobium tamadayense]RRH96890.1 4-aminobutyrate--2-oxoglutarate transaminase [Mesorhizobium tamadayense]